MAFIDIDDDDDDDDDDYATANFQNWGTEKSGFSGAKKVGATFGGDGLTSVDQMKPHTLKLAARNNPKASELLDQHRENVASSPMMQRSRWKKRGAVWTAGGATAAGIGVGAINTAAGGAVLGGATLGTTTGWAAVAGGGVSLLGGPFALLAAGTALSVGGSIRQGRATYKTNKHIQNLEAILAAATQGEFHCEASTAPDHHNIVHQVLPYIIAKKKKKRMRKAIRTVPVVGMVELARSSLKKADKWRRDAHGKARGVKAHQLALHHVGSDCELTTAIIAELFSIDEAIAEEARFLNDVTLGKVLEKKMKSV